MARVPAVVVVTVLGVVQFMRWFVDGDPDQTFGRCVADPFAPPGALYLIEPMDGTEPIVGTTPATWAEYGARHLAAAYHPEGMP